MLRVRLRALPEPVQVVVPDTVKYGLLYNWYAATDVRNICVDGWHVSTDGEWSTLVAYLGGLSVAGGKLKEINFTYFDSPNTGATNEVAFNARGGSFRYSDSVSGEFANFFKKYGVYHTSTEINSTTSYNRAVYYESATVFRNADTKKQAGYSLRPVKDSTILTHGQSGTYVGNNGKAYRTICIGTQEWLADNLAETKFSNGDYIPGFDAGVYTPFTNAAWAALTTAGCCAYNDDTSNI